MNKTGIFINAPYFFNKASIATLTITSFPTGNPPVSRSKSASSPKSLRLRRVLTWNVTRVLPQGSSAEPVNLTSIEYRDLSRDSAKRQISFNQHFTLWLSLDSCAAKGHCRICSHIKKAGTAHVRIPVLMMGANAGSIGSHFNFRQQRVFCYLDFARN